MTVDELFTSQPVEKKKLTANELFSKTPKVQAKAQEPGYFERVGYDFASSAKDVVQGVKSGADAINQNDGSLGGGFKAAGQLVRTGLRTAGAVASSAFAPILQAPGIKQLTEAIATGVTKLPGAESAIQSAQEIATQHPEAAKDIQNVIDILALGTGSALQKPIAGEVRAVGKDVAGLAKSALTPSEEQVQKKVVDLFSRSIKPSPKKTVVLNDKYNGDVVSALRTIKSNSDKLEIEDGNGELVARTPQSISELAQSVEQTKKLVFQQYNDIAKQAGSQGVTIDAEDIAKELDLVGQNKALQIASPEVIDYANTWAGRLRGFGQLDTETAQEVIKVMNNNLQSFYRNPSYDTASKVAIDAGIANNFRKSLDNAIETATGEQYQALKNQYGALKAIENDVARATMRDAKRNVKGLLDYTDMFTGGQMVTGILSLNPAMFTKGAIERGFKEYIRFLNDPNRAVSNMFDVLDSGNAQPFTPTSETFKAIQNPGMGMSISPTVRPDLVAKGMDDGGIKIIETYLANPADIPNYGKAVRLINDIGIGEANEATQLRFLKDVVAEYRTP